MKLRLLVFLEDAPVRLDGCQMVLTLSIVCEWSLGSTTTFTLVLMWCNYYRHNFNDEAKGLGDSPTPRRANALNAKRLALRARIESHRKRRDLFMEEIGEPDRPRIQHLYEEEDEDEALDLTMPSSFARATVESAGLATLAEVERELRRSMCKESLESVKRLLGAKAATKRYKDQNVRGQIANTRANVALKEQDSKIRNAQWRYNNSHKALVQLGVSETDNKLFKELKADDLVPLAHFFRRYAETVGHGRGQNGLPWIWATSAAPNTDDWEVDGQYPPLTCPIDYEILANTKLVLKTEWFRSRERYKRWQEQLILLKREMVMTIRSFQKYEELWQWKAHSPGITPGMRAYASGRAKFFAQLAHQMLVACHKQLFVGCFFKISTSYAS